MNSRKFNKNHKSSRLERVERKCDRILSELAIIRSKLHSHSDTIDDAIDRMHRNARRMKAAAVRDAHMLRKVFQSKITD